MARKTATSEETIAAWIEDPAELAGGQASPKFQDGRVEALDMADRQHPPGALPAVQRRKPPARTSAPKTVAINMAVPKVSGFQRSENQNAGETINFQSNILLLHKHQTVMVLPGFELVN